MKFCKMQGAGNDFIIINNISGGIAAEKLPALAKRLCSRRLSLGADGLMVTVPPEHGGDFGMLFYNSDGSLGEMCGNGARCIARWGFEKGLAGERQRIETTAGMVTGERVSRREYRVRLNDPSFTDTERRVSAGGQDYTCAYIELGDPCIPHAVLLMDDWQQADRDRLRRLGRELRFSPVFPKGANISFVKIQSEDFLNALTYERGVEDFTLACGTGCGSIVTALTLKGLVSGRDVKVQMPGGLLSVSIEKTSPRVSGIFLTGPTNIIAEGEILDEELRL